MTKTSKEMEVECLTVLFPNDIKAKIESYIFTSEELQAYREQLCREQRERCADKYIKTVNESAHPAKHVMAYIIRNATIEE